MNTAELLAQRDELLAALEATAAWWYGTPAANPKRGYGFPGSQVHTMVLSAIDKVKDAQAWEKHQSAQAPKEQA